MNREVEAGLAVLKRQLATCAPIGDFANGDLEAAVPVGVKARLKNDFYLQIRTDESRDPKKLFAVRDQRAVLVLASETDEEHFPVALHRTATGAREYDCRRILETISGPERTESSGTGRFDGETLTFREDP